MDPDDIAAAVREAGLEALAERFPEEIVAAVALARTQREALAAVRTDPP